MRPSPDAQSPDASNQGRLKNRPAVAAPDSTKVSAFAVDIENLNVDKIAMRDGGIRPDGNRDLVFRATVEGPADALYLVTTSQKGEPHHGFRADTISGHEELPSSGAWSTSGGSRCGSGGGEQQVHQRRWRLARDARAGRPC